MRLEKHCAHCLEVLGAEFVQVHLWLDALANKPAHERKYKNDLNAGSHVGPLNPYHRKHRHNHEGIEAVRSIWGDDAAEAAKLHILDDFYGPGPHNEKQVSEIPLDERDYVRKGWI